MKNDYIKKMNDNIINEINAITKSCSEFKIYCDQKDGKYGIWLDTNSALILLDPLLIYGSIFKEYEELFLTYYQDGECKSDTRYKLHIYIGKHTLIHGSYALLTLFNTARGLTDKTVMSRKLKTPYLNYMLSGQKATKCIMSTMM